MSHELEIVNGEGQMFSVNKKPWHELGQILDKPPTIIEGIQAAGLDWTVGMESLVTQNGIAVPDKFATVRNTDNSVLGVVGSYYKPVQNIEAFNWFQPFLDEGVASLESAGSLFNGKKVWVLAKINDDNLTVVKNDEIERYILLSNSHDGSTAVKMGFTPVRVVCNNTLNYAYENSNSQLIRVFHTQKVKEVMEMVREVMNVSNQGFEATIDQYKKMAKMDMSQADLDAFVKRVFKRDNELNNEAEEMEEGKERQNKIITRVTDLFENGMGNDMKGVRGTAWAAYNAVVEYIQYERGSSKEQRFNNLWFKRGNSNKAEKAMKLLLAA